MKLISFITFLLSIFLFTEQAYGLISFEDGVFPELGVSGRALAMGNAYISKVDDSAAVFYNPAGLGTVRYPHLHISNIHLEVNKDWVDLGTGGTLSNAGGNFMKGFKVDGTRQLLKDSPGKFAHSRFQIMPNFTARYISFGYLFSKQARGYLGEATTDLFQYADRRDHGPYAALNLSIFGGIFKVGASVIYLNRKEAFGEGDRNTTITLDDSDYNSGSATIFTTGAKLTLPVAALPTFSIKINNSASQEFKQSSGSAAAPDKIKPSVDLGFSLTPQVGKVVRTHLEVNYKDSTQKHSDVGSARRVAFGMEVDIARRFFVRAGYGDGFGSGGIGIRTKKLEFDLTTYAVDTTTSQFRGKEDRRFSLTLSSGF
ncbi:MAG: hypothetical protein GY909_06245 [Oligoflexia bacterium]|nr:hypothetical protein [Oligoflexia bacterium]